MSAKALTDAFDVEILSNEKKEVFDFFSDWIFILDNSQSKIVYSNSQITSVLGLDFEQFNAIKSSFLAHFYKALAEQFETVNLANLEVHQTAELVVETPTFISLRLKITPFRVKNETSHRYFLISAEKNNTHHQSTDDRIKELEAQLWQANKSNADLEQFAYVASHDLREPLRKIIAFGEQLESRFSASLPEDGKFLLSRMTNATLRMTQLIDDLLSYSRIANGENKFEKCNLNDLWFQVMETLDTQIKEKKATITVGQLPEIEGIKPQLQQLFQNLLSNALKFTNPNHDLQIGLEATKVNPTNENPMLRPTLDYYQIVLRDNGIGFEQKYADKIFELFQRLHGRSTYEGTGLGLAICKKIVTNHQGVIEAFGEENKGATFVIYLPERQFINK